MPARSRPRKRPLLRSPTVRSSGLDESRSTIRQAVSGAWRAIARSGEANDAATCHKPGIGGSIVDQPPLLAVQPIFCADHAGKRRSRITLRRDWVEVALELSWFAVPTAIQPTIDLHDSQETEDDHGDSTDGGEHCCSAGVHIPPSASPNWRSTIRSARLQLVLGRDRVQPRVSPGEDGIGHPTR